MPHKRFRWTCHVLSVVDAAIAEKGHLWTEISYRSRVIRLVILWSLYRWSGLPR
jgi:hypothetical protein